MPDFVVSNNRIQLYKGNTLYDLQGTPAGGKLQSTFMVYCLCWWRIHFRSQSLFTKKGSVQPIRFNHNIFLIRGGTGTIFVPVTSIKHFNIKIKSYQKDRVLVELIFRVWIQWTWISGKDSIFVFATITLVHETIKLIATIGHSINCWEKWKKLNSFM